MLISRKEKKALLDRIQDSESVTLDEVVRMIDEHVEEPDVARLIAKEKKRVARGVITSIRGKDNVRTCLALCDKDRTFVNIDRCDGYDKLLLIEKQLRAKRNGINRSLGKVTYMKRALGLCVGQNGADSKETTAMVEKLYAMADELQALLAV